MTEKLDDKLMTDHQVAMTIENEGVGYAVLHYMDSTSIRSPETKKLWDDAENALKALMEHLGVED